MHDQIHGLYVRHFLQIRTIQAFFQSIYTRFLSAFESGHSVLFHNFYTVFAVCQVHYSSEDTRQS